MTNSTNANVTLETITMTIIAKTGQAALLFIEVGGLLEQAKSHFMDGDKFNGKDWLNWAMSECGIKKAQVYNLISVYKAFGDVKCFHNCAMRVLLVLSKESNQDMRDNALAAIEEGKKVDSRWIKEYLAKEKQEAEEAEAAEAEINNDEPENSSTDNQTEEAEESQESNDESDDEPQASCADAEEAEAAQDEQPQAKATNEEVSGLQAEIERLKAELAEANKPKRKPRLNQFDTGISYIILGVAPTATKREIKKAYRMLSSMYHPDKNSTEDKDFYNEITAIINAAHDDMTK